MDTVILVLFSTLRVLISASNHRMHYESVESLGQFWKPYQIIRTKFQAGPNKSAAQEF